MIVVLKLGDGVYYDEENDHIYTIDVMESIGIGNFEIIEDDDEEED